MPSILVDVQFNFPIASSRFARIDAIENQPTASVMAVQFKEVPKGFAENVLFGFFENGDYFTISFRRTEQLSAAFDGFTGGLPFEEVREFPGAISSEQFPMRHSPYCMTPHKKLQRARATQSA